MDIQEVENIIFKIKDFVYKELKHEFDNFPKVEIVKNNKWFGAYNIVTNIITLNSYNIHRYSMSIAKNKHYYINAVVKNLILETIIHELCHANQMIIKQRRIEKIIKFNAVVTIYNRNFDIIQNFLEDQLILFRDFVNIVSYYVAYSESQENCLPRFRKASRRRIVCNILYAWLNLKKIKEKILILLNSIYIQ